MSPDASSTNGTGHLQRHPQQHKSPSPGCSINGRPPNKRRRIAMACNSCRNRKSRCDGARPWCSMCQSLGYECEYQSSDLTANVMVKKDYITDLEGRLSNIERDLDTLFSRSDGTASDLNCERPPKISVRNGRDQPHTTMHAHEKFDPSGLDRGVSVDGNDPRGGLPNEDPTDGMGAIIFTDEQDSSFFGPSSNIAFTRHIASALARTTKHNAPGMPSALRDDRQFEGGILNVSRIPSPVAAYDESNRSGTVKADVNVYLLPPELETRNLITRYFSNTGLLYPYLHEPTFLETYAQMKNNNFTKVGRRWLAILNMVLALSTCTTVENGLTAKKRAEESDIYYQRALRLCGSQLMRGTSLEIVQCLLLMVQYLQGTQISVQTWTNHGLAVKAALSLGLHSSEASKRFSPLEQEVRKRTWFGCVLLDRNLSMTFGRPATIPDSYVKIALPNAFEDANSPAQHTSLCFYNATIELYRSLWKVIDSLYGGNIGCDGPPTELELVTTLLKIEQDLLIWEHRLPPELTLRRSQDIRPIEGDHARLMERFRNILTLRYHNVRILLHRPILVKLLESANDRRKTSGGAAFSPHIGLNSLNICIKSAEEIIFIVHALTTATVSPGGTQQRLLGAWWFSLYYTFNAALVLFGSLLVRDDDDAITALLQKSDESSRTSIGMAVEALARLDSGNRMVDKCREYLERLRQLLNSRSSNTPPPHAGEEASFDHLVTGEEATMSQAVFNDVNILNQSPFNIDLGEFMEGFWDPSQFIFPEEI